MEGSTEVGRPRVSMPVKRKLTTILAADVESFTRLMRENEEETLKTLSEFREIIDNLIDRHEGRIFSTAGDSVLAEFGSTVEAVRCAISFQEEITARNALLPADRRLQFRIGLNVGDVMAKGDDLYGDGVNVAARLEGLAGSGGICISGAAFEQIKHKISLGFEDMGAQEVKNINEPISAYRLVSSPVAVNPSGGEATIVKEAKPKKEKKVKAEKTENTRRGFRIPAKKTLACLIVVGFAVVWFEPSMIPGVRATCGQITQMTNQFMNLSAPGSIAARARQQESWGYRLQRLWAKAQKELCY